MKTCDYLVVGAGIVGLTIARELARRKAGRIFVLEKEPRLGAHASGRNSGVLHTGVYYAPDSWKAKCCAEGARRMAAYAAERGVPLKKTGKVIVAATAAERPGLEALYERAVANGVRVEKISEQRLKNIEPEARTVGEALYTIDTAVIDSTAVLAALEKDLERAGVAVEKSEEVVRADPARRELRTRRERIGYGHFVNAAGLHADRVAHWFGAASNYAILPFKGIYRKLRPAAASRFRGSIYPVPDLRMPFLGVHLTRTIDDSVIVGPTAMPAFGRENYGALRGIAWNELPRIAFDLAGMILGDRDGLRGLVGQEIAKYAPSNFFACAQRLAPGLTPADFTSSNKVGIRAQLLDRRRGKLVTDFVVENSPHATHILNAVSPAFTSSFVFAEKVVDGILKGKELCIA